LECLMT